MRPRKLTLENVGPFVGRTDIDFDALGDIFLITGKTGSGKTTVFDSICYALYGSLPGGRSGQARKLRSDFASEDADCAVSLEFDLGDRSFRVERTPPRLRRKARGEGWIEDPEMVALYEKKQGFFAPLNGKKADADKRIEELIGLSFDEFSKIVLLPQGEFAEFLKQNTSERRAVLRKLFPVDHAVRAQELAAARAAAARARLDEAERAMADTAARFDADTYDADKKAAAERVEAAAERARRLEAAREELNAALRGARAASELNSSLDSARKAERELDQEAPLIREAELRLASCRSARPIAPLLSRREEAASAAERERQRAADAERQLKELRIRADGVESRRGEAESAEREAAVLREKRGPLAEAAADERALEQAKAQILDLEGKEREARSVKEAAEQAARARTREIEALRGKAETAEAAQGAWEAARAAMENARAVKPLAERADRLRAERDAAAGALSALEAELAARTAEEPILKAELEEIERLLKEAEAAGHAAILASELRPGCPCPVCGSLDHPEPAAAPRQTFDLGARREVRRRNAEDAAKTLAAKHAEAAAARIRLERLDGELAELAAQAAEKGVKLPTAPEAAKELAARSEAANAALAPLNDARKAQARLSALYREAEVQDAELKRVDQALATLAASRAAAAAAAAEKERRRENALRAIGVADRASDALAELDRQIAEKERAAASWKAAREDAVKALSGAEASRAAAAEAFGAAEKTAHAAREAFASLLERSPFADEEALRAALLDQDEEARLEREIPDWKERLSRARTRREELEKAFEKAAADQGRQAGCEDFGCAQLEADLERNQAERAQAAAERDGAIGAAAELERNAAAYGEAADRRRTLAAESALIKTLADDLAGSNPKKKAFDSWLLGAYLSEVAAFATKRLERMSEGRYRLLLDEDREGGRGRAGLDLAVFDSYTGRARPCSTLSGGESFMASISLALGLADSIQARSGGVRLDAVFIDEGFGSLDDASLDKALGILDEIRDHRMVGLISHVGELKNRIPSRLEIVKTSAGSKISGGAGGR